MAYAKRCTAIITYLEPSVQQLKGSAWPLLISHQAEAQTQSMTAKACEGPWSQQGMSASIFGACRTIMLAAPVCLEGWQAAIYRKGREEGMCVHITISDFMIWNLQASMKLVPGTGTNAGMEQMLKCTMS